jgi:predicted GIY-YIG superfamily endonuclease
MTKVQPIAYTRGKLPWKLIYHEAYNSKGEAMIREREIKDKKDREFCDVGSSRRTERQGSCNET